MWLPFKIGVVFTETPIITDILPKSKTSLHSHTKSHVHFYYFLSIYPLLEISLIWNVFPYFGWKCLFSPDFPDWNVFKTFPDRWEPWSLLALRELFKEWPACSLTANAVEFDKYPRSLHTPSHLTLWDPKTDGNANSTPPPRSVSL